MNMVLRVPIDRLLDAVKWTALPPPHVQTAEDPDALYATHEGVLQFAEGVAFRCYVLNDDSRVFDADDLQALFGGQET